MKKFKPLFHCFAALLFTLLAPDNALPNSEQNFDNIFMTLLEEYERDARRLHENFPVNPAESIHFVKELERKRMYLFREAHEASHESRNEEAALKLTFSEKYQKLVANGLHRLIEEGTRLKNNDEYAEAASILEGVHGISPVNETAIRNLGCLYFDWSVVLLMKLGRDRAKDMRERFRQWCLLADNCNTCGKSTIKIWFNNGMKLCREGIEKNDADIIRQGIAYFDQVRFFDENYPGLGSATMKCRRFFIDCRYDLEEATALCRENRVMEAQNKLDDIRENPTSTCLNSISWKQDQLFRSGVSAFQLYEFEASLLEFKCARLLSTGDSVAKIDAYVAIAEQLLMGKRHFSEENYSAMIYLLNEIKQYRIEDEDAHVKFANEYIERCKRHLQEEEQRRCEDLKYKARISYENFIKSPIYLKDYLELESNFKKASQACGSGSDSAYEQRLENARLEYLKRHYVEGTKLTRENRLAEAWCHFMAVEKMDPTYEKDMVRSYLTIIEGRVKGLKAESCPSADGE